MIVELRSVPDCPNLDATRSTLAACLAEAGLTVPIIERVGDYRSPSILINGADVTGADPSGPPACVLRPPTAPQIRAALHSAIRSAPAS
ncbi:alkylmercury lyase [Krasilnikovia sp. MM14-A1259]|uniref:alkylmercury lyase n=1 Tax=Krasilnikovia sp. MM14-A1259 TaxID=3373539 RepID=UPI0037F60534